MNRRESQSSTRIDPINVAIEALTDIARGTRVIGQGSSKGHREPVDFAEIACHVITATAANIGGVETLLAGRPGSWEADYVRQIVHSTAGLDEVDLLRFRTEPVCVGIDVEEAFEDFGLRGLYGQDREQAINLEQDEGLTDEQSAEASLLIDVIDRLWAEDGAAYREACLAAVRNELIARGVAIAVKATERDFRQGLSGPFVDELHELVRRVAPLPMTGEAPDWANGTPADAVRRAGLSYADRAQVVIKWVRD